MFEIEQMEREFDYSLVDNETAEFLRSCEYEMNGIAEDARIQFGRVLKRAQDRLASHHKGVFYKWFESGGLNKHDVYYAINLYELSANLDNTQRDNFLNAPKTLQKEVMKKNAPEELKDKVFDGDITTNKEYQEMKRKLKEIEQAKRQAEKQAEQAKKSEEIALKKLEEEQSKEPEKIEVVPDDYDFYKGNYNSAISLQKRYKEQMEEMRKELNSVNETEDELEKERRKKEALQLKADNDVLSLANNIDDFLKENAVTSYREGAIASSDKTTKETLKECISALKSFTSEIERSLHGRIKI